MNMDCGHNMYGIGLKLNSTYPTVKTSLISIFSFAKCKCYLREIQSTPSVSYRRNNFAKINSSHHRCFHHPQV